MAVVRIALALLLSAPLAVLAQAWPSKPIRVVVPYPPGGAIDALARTIAPKMGEALGQPIVVDNRAGAGGMVGADIVAKSPPDGNTLLIVSYPPHNVLPVFYRSVPFDGVKDFTPVVMVVTVPQGLAVHPSLPVSTLKELVDHAKRNPGKLSYGTAGVGTLSHVAGEMLKGATGIDMVHVAYKGGAAVLNDLLGGQIPVGFVVLSYGMPHVRAGKIRMLGVVQDKRARSAPDIPTLGEAGVTLDLGELFFGLVGPAGLPEPIVARLNADVMKAAVVPEVRSRLESLGFEVAGGTPADFARTVARHTVVYRKFAVDANIRPE